MTLLFDLIFYRKVKFTRSLSVAENGEKKKQIHDGRRKNKYMMGEEKTNT
jgi:hypothetical protein